MEKCFPRKTYHDRILKREHYENQSGWNELQKLLKYICKLPKSSNADKQRDFLYLTDNVTLFVVTNNRFAKQSFHKRTVREEERFRALEIDTIIRKDYLEH